ncbi:hypothetical protein QBC37DRAFT_26966 [Rhypophila decipiens]|uniref:Uncharacterized protein n=1 Tax=Rhypophila decipiens TaxID=261697 RepID=A0AAN6Y3W0_9PEZI|nr:hypothetical protein QBC37DRAFT_26966 [Rhypophila decipiens]
MVKGVSGDYLTDEYLCLRTYASHLVTTSVKPNSAESSTFKLDRHSSASIIASLSRRVFSSPKPDHISGPRATMSYSNVRPSPSSPRRQPWFEIDEPEMEPVQWHDVAVSAIVSATLVILLGGNSLMLGLVLSVVVVHFLVMLLLGGSERARANRYGHVLTSSSDIVRNIGQPTAPFMALAYHIVRPNYRLTDVVFGEHVGICSDHQP